MQYLDTDARIYFSVVTAGALVPGLLPGNFTATVVNPANDATTSPAVAESTQAGVYYFDIPASFLATHGAGDYVATVVSVAPADVQTFRLAIQDRPADVRASVTWDAASNFVRVNTWLTRPEGLELDGLENAVLELFDEDGVSLAVGAPAAVPDAQGVFSFDIAAPAFAVGEHATYFVASIDQVWPAATPVRTYTSIVGVTFSRTA